MALNNNRKIDFPSAAARLAMLPLVRSACATLSVLYTETKQSHPGLKSVCEMLESSVTSVGSSACSIVSPVIVKLEPQISVANVIACKSLDWLETLFPVLLSPTDQVVAAAKNKMHNIKDVASTAMQHTALWAMIQVNQDDGGANLVKRAISVAGVGLDSALSLSETLVEQIFPPVEEDEVEEKGTPAVESFDIAKVRGRYPERLFSLATKLYRRIGLKFQSVQVCCEFNQWWMEGFVSDHEEIFQSLRCDSDQLEDSDGETPGAASLPATPGCLFILLCHPDVPLEETCIPTWALDSLQYSTQGHLNPGRRPSHNIPSFEEINGFNLTTGPM